MNIDSFFIFTIISIFAIVSLSFVIALSRADKKTKSSFVLFALAVSLFMGVLYFSNINLGNPWNLILNRGVFIIVPWMVYGIDFVIRSSLQGKKSVSNTKLLVLDLGLSIYASTNYFIQGIIIKGSGSSAYPSLIVSDFVYFPYILLTVLPLFPIFYRLYKSSKELTGFNNQRSKTLLLSTVSVFVLLILTNVVFPNFGVNSTSSFAPLWMLFWVFSVYYSIANQRLFGIRHLIFKLVQFSIDGIVFSSTILSLLFLVKFFNLSISTSLFIPLLPVSILIVMLYPLYTQFLNDLLEKLLKINEKETSNILSDFIVNVSRTVEFKEIFDETVKVMKSLFQAEKITFLLTNEEKERFFISSNKKMSQSDSLRIFNLLSTRNYSRKSNLLLTDEIETFSRRYPKLLPLLKKNNIEVIARLFDNNRYLGVLIIQSREDATSYSLDEVNNLRIVISNITISLGRSMLFSEIQRFNEVLQDKIDKATSALEKRNDTLKVLRDRERDMMDIIGHELRTPLAIIKINLGLLEMKLKLGQDVSLEKLEDTYKKIKDATKRESRLLETMISSTKVDAGHVELYFEKIDLLSILKESILAQSETAKIKKLQLHLHTKDKNTFVFADKIRTAEVFDNLIGNAVKYTDEGKVDVFVSTKNKNVNVSIVDTGIGIPKKNLSRLGSKFYRVGQYIEGESSTKNVLHVVRPGGTGLGLYVSFGLVKLMNGDVKVESELGKGSVFSVSLPKYVGQKEVGTVGKVSKNVFDQLGLHNKGNNI